LHSSTHGRIAAELAVRIMKGEKPSAMPVLIESTNPYMFDYKQLERWNISKSALPAGSIFINEPFSFYKTYKKIIWVVIIAFVTLILFVVALSFNVYRRKKIQNDLINEISERKRTEKILKESEERFKIIFDQATVGISQIESKTGQFIRVNQRFCDIFGFTKEEITSKTFMGITHPDDLQEDLNKMKKLIAGEIREFSMEKRYFHKNGAIVLGNLFVSPMWGVGKEPNYHIAIVEDITERKTKEQKMRQVQKMEAMGILAGGIAHDFNNILAGIIGYAELARDDTPKNSPLKDYLEGILKSSNRAKDLVSQILTFSRKSQEKRQPVQLSMIVEEAAKLIRSTIPTTIKIRQNIDDAIAFINADPTQMHQIVINLCTNAAHAMQETEGVLEIVLSSIDITQEFIIKYHDISPGPFLKLEISDTGTGIDPKIIHRIFEPFFTTKEREKGTGMGLAVVHGIVKDHGGDISMNSQLGKGTTFTILLPQVISRPAKEEDTESEIPTGNEHILFVDDEKVLMDLLKKILESLGYTVTVMNSSIEALETFQKLPNTFDIVITDQTMPHMTGYNLAKRILEIKPLIPVIICTGYSETLTVEKAEAAGIRALIYKPINKKEFAVNIRKVLDNNNQK
jgi:two-component system cell cycle sensor histidine kinase/response regulator CckA